MAGSSPRLWGTLGIAYYSAKHRRFIPTLVGNAKRLAQHMERTSVHPHACGEREDEPDGFIRVAGSSPRLWGTQDSGETECR